MSQPWISVEANLMVSCDLCCLFACLPAWPPASCFPVCVEYQTYQPESPMWKLSALPQRSAHYFAAEGRHTALPDESSPPTFCWVVGLSLLWHLKMMLRRRQSVRVGKEIQIELISNSRSLSPSWRSVQRSDQIAE